MRIRRCLAAVLLPALLLSACYRSVEVYSPRPEERLDRVVLRSGETIDFRSTEMATFRDSAVVVLPSARGRLGADSARDSVWTIPEHDIRGMYVQQLDAPRTALAVGGVALSVGVLFLIVMGAMLDDAGEAFCEEACVPD